MVPSPERQERETVMGKTRIGQIMSRSPDRSRSGMKGRGLQSQLSGLEGRGGVLFEGEDSNHAGHGCSRPAVQTQKGELELLNFALSTEGGGRRKPGGLKQLLAPCGKTARNDQGGKTSIPMGSRITMAEGVRKGYVSPGFLLSSRGKKRGARRTH